MTDILDDLVCFPGKWVLPGVAEARRTYLTTAGKGKRPSERTRERAREKERKLVNYLQDRWSANQEVKEAERGPIDNFFLCIFYQSGMICFICRRDEENGVDALDLNLLKDAWNRGSELEDKVNSLAKRTHPCRFEYW